MLRTKGEEYSPRRVRDEPDKLGSETTMLGGVHDIRERPSRSVRNGRVDRTDAPDRDNGLGGHLDLPKDLRGIEVEESRCAIETDAQWVRGPSGRAG